MLVFIDIQRKRLSYFKYLSQYTYIFTTLECNHVGKKRKKVFPGPSSFLKNQAHPQDSVRTKRVEANCY